MYTHRKEGGSCTTHTMGLSKRENVRAVPQDLCLIVAVCSSSCVLLLLSPVSTFEIPLIYQLSLSLSLSLSPTHALLLFSVRPKSVSIIEKPDFVRAGEDYGLECQAKGSKPEANVTWYRNGVPIDRSKITVRLDLIGMKLARLRLSKCGIFSRPTTRSTLP